MEQNSNQFSWTIAPEKEGLRLDSYLKAQLEEQSFSRNQIQKWIKQGAVLSSGQACLQSHRLKAGETISLLIPAEETSASPDEIPLDIIFEDAGLVVVNKPAGMLVHPAGAQYRGTLVNALAFHLQKNKKDQGHFSQFEGLRPGIVHRLDKETSGVLVVAKTTRILEKLARQFRDREVEKVYRAVVIGQIKSKRGEIEGSIGKRFHSPKMGMVPSGRFSRTEFKVLKLFPGHTYLEVYPKTGRTHQIRVHLAEIGYPVLGDKLYEPSQQKIPRHMLHAHKLTITHPVSGKDICFTAPLPPDFLACLSDLGKPIASSKQQATSRE